MQLLGQTYHMCQNLYQSHGSNVIGVSRCQSTLVNLTGTRGGGAKFKNRKENKERNRDVYEWNNLLNVVTK